MQTPVFDKLINYHKENRISFAMPGHKNGAGLNYELLKCDVTELSSTLDLLNSSEEITLSEQLLSKLYKSDRSFILTCGSTIAIHSMLLSVLKRGDTLLAADDCHISVANMCEIMGVNIEFIKKEYNPSGEIPYGISSIKKYLENNKNIKACIITSPNYYGVCSDISQIAKECHSFNIPLLVDEAHGAHFIASDIFPQTAIEQGADISCQSAHKTLNALTGAAYMHIKSNIANSEELHGALKKLHTSSPSYVIAASADIARATLGDSKKWENIAKKCNEIKQRITSNTNITFLDNDDITRLVLILDNYNITGHALSRVLSQKYNIDVEMSGLNNIVLIVTPWNTEKDLDYFAEAIEDITKNPSKYDTASSSNTNAKQTNIDKISSKETEYVSICSSIGRKSAVSVAVYPPGVPFIHSGSVITKENVEYLGKSLKSGAKIIGIKDENIEVFI